MIFVVYFLVGLFSLCAAMREQSKPIKAIMSAIDILNEKLFEINGIVGFIFMISVFMIEIIFFPVILLINYIFLK